MTEEEYIKKVCENIKRIREEKGMKQIDLANKLNIDDSSLRRIESGRTNPTLKTIYRIAIALSINISDLLPKPLK